MKNIFILIFIALAMIGCKSINSLSTKESSNNSVNSPNNGKIYPEEKSDVTGVIIELPKLAKLSPDEITKQLGEPKREWSVGSVGTARTYDVKQGEAELTIIFSDNKISSLELELSTMRDSADDALRSGGFEIKDKPDWENSIAKTYKNRLFNGVRFREIEVLMSPPKQKWNSLRVEVGGK